MIEPAGISWPRFPGLHKAVWLVWRSSWLRGGHFLWQERRRKSHYLLDELSSSGGHGAESTEGDAVYAQASDLLFDTEEQGGDEATSHLGKYDPRKW